MASWQVTATTIYCDAVDDDVTLMVYKDRLTRCVGYKKYIESITKETAKELKKRAKKLGRELRCEGPECSRVIVFRDEVFAEKAAAKS
ncbi:MAG: hypothetical protein V3S84_04030 [Dehalococcoidales bacterium]